MANRFAAINTKKPEQLDIEDAPKAEIGRPVERATRGPGRPATGKRSDPAFEKVGVYLNADIHKRVKQQLLEAGAGDLSDLIGKLLAAHLGDR